MENTTKTLANGSIYDLEAKKLITGPTNPPFNDPAIRQKAAETRRQRHEMTKNRVLRGMCEKAAELGKIPVITDDEEGEMVQAVASHMAGYLWDDNIDDKGRYIVDVKARESLRKGLFQDADLTPRAYAKDEAETAGARISIDLSPDTAAALVEAAARYAIKQGNDK
jgi:hypothetical protein